MKTYGCLGCGRALESTDCVWTDSSFLHLGCPGCGSAVCVSGTALIIVGLMWLLFWSMILCVQAEIVGIVGCLAFSVIGAWRVARQLLARRRTARR